MLTISKYLNGGSPIACRNCSQPFPIVANHYIAWDGQDGSYYSTPDCEQEALQAKVRRSRVLS
jgi:hypothetical protein